MLGYLAELVYDDKFDWQSWKQWATILFFLSLGWFFSVGLWLSTGFWKKF